jgi:hypothetical protein
VASSRRAFLLGTPGRAHWPDSEPDANALLKRSGFISVAPLRAPSRSGVTLRQRKRADSKIRDVREVFTHKHDFSAINALETGANFAYVRLNEHRLLLPP